MRRSGSRNSPSWGTLLQTPTAEHNSLRRARIIAAGDDARRRIERDLHDGAQQQLVTLAVALRRAEAKLPNGLDERAEVKRVADGLATAIDDLRELSRGIHPSILAEGGLPPALKALGRRSLIRVKLDIGFEHRVPGPSRGSHLLHRRRGAHERIEVLAR